MVREILILVDAGHFFRTTFRTTGAEEIPFSVRKAVRRVVGPPSAPAPVVLAPGPGLEPARQLAFDLDQPRVEKPAGSPVDLLIRATLARCQPDLELPPVRVSGRMRRTLGSYTPSRKQIAVSSRLLAMGDDADIRQVVLHEVAHAIVHARFGEKTSAHGREFRVVCSELDIKPRRHVDVTTEKWQSRVRFLSKCGHCKVIIVRKRRMGSVRCGCGLKVYPKSWLVVAPAAVGRNDQWVAL